MSELLGGWKRNSMCAEVSSKDVGKELTVMGWVQRRRDLGGLIFLWVRDRSGILQAVFNVESGCFAKAETLRSEFVIAVRGKVALRTPENINPALPTGEVELIAEELKILNEAETPPFEIEEASKVREELRLKYRYIDLRRPDMQRTLMLRSKLTSSARSFMSENGFLEIETPILQKSTPEGARDYLVPSRIHAGKFYALPQSPQIFKQLLMVSGFDRYYQIARCFRDEDLRADRQPEFTQIDMELSFVEMEDVIEINERLLSRVFKDTLGVELNLPLKRITYSEAMEKYGSDKPDTRFGLELVEISDIAANCSFKVFADTISNGGCVRAINAKAIFPRKEIDALGEWIKTVGAKGLAWMAFKPEGITSPIAKFLSESEIKAIAERVDAQTGDTVFFVADTKKVVCCALGALRLELAERLKLINHDTIDLLWVTQFPLFEYSEEDERYVAMHHPFTAPLDEDLELLESEPEKVRAKAYDIVMNGNEIGGGSIRIHGAPLQEKMFKALGFTKEEAWERFGFMMEAFKYGTPPHGGLAYGLDRMSMLMSGCTSIRDVIAFPKVQNASCLMTQCPAEVDEKQLEELFIAIRPEGNKN